MGRRTGTQATSAATGYIEAEGRQVVWTMTQDEARDVARWMREVLSPDDAAHADADALDAAADSLTPAWADDAPGIRISVVMK